MLKNEELNMINEARTILMWLDNYTEKHDDFYKTTHIPNEDIRRATAQLHYIYTKYSLKKQQASEKANEWNKTHPERHRLHSRESARKKQAHQ